MSARFPVVSEETAFLMQEALQGSRYRLAVLLVADACLLLVGVYLIFSWSGRVARHRPEPPPKAMSAKGYINWEDDGQRGSIATGPVEATFKSAPDRPAQGADEGQGPVEEQGRRAGQGIALPMDPAAAAPDGGEGGAREGGAREGGAREGGAREGGAREGGAREGGAREGGAREGGAREGRAREGGAREGGAREGGAAADRQALEAAQRMRAAASRDRFLKEIPGKVRESQQEIRRCYQQVLSLRQGVFGDLDVEFELSADGSVQRARPARNTTRSATLGSCVAGVFMKMRFSSPPGGPVVLRYPFRFAPKAR
ncbi:MAG: AgmX/PglI C-terminal domain-containing protein [Polyangia bacterium]|nr:AgmX/PglI C-terminal domain-containing protein [Polyangia bacterium]